jgi:hypothetical protein
MVQTIMLFSLGFLSASLLTLILMPFVHNRAERLTLRRIDASVPLQIEEVHARRDQLRAEFAVATRRLEATIEQLRARMATLRAELGRKAAAINRLTGALAANGIATESEQETALAWNIPDEAAAADDHPRAVVWPSADGGTEVARLKAELDERARTTDAQRIEIVTLKLQLDVLRYQLAETSAPAPARIDPKRPRAAVRLAS